MSNELPYELAEYKRRVTELEAERDGLKTYAKDIRRAREAEAGRLRSDRDGLRGVVEDLTSERDTLKARLAVADGLVAQFRKALIGDEAEPWRSQANIVRDWMPRFPRSNTRPLPFVVEWRGSYLRHSHGVSGRPFWDIYPDDCLNEAWATIVLSRAPTPHRLAGFSKSVAMLAIEADEQAEEARLATAPPLPVADTLLSVAGDGSATVVAPPLPVSEPVPHLVSNGWRLYPNERDVLTIPDGTSDHTALNSVLDSLAEGRRFVVDDKRRPPTDVPVSEPYCELAASEIPNFGTDRDTHRCGKLHRAKPLSRTY